MNKRPGWVWAISIYIFCSAVFLLLSFYLIYSGKVVLDPKQKTYFESLSYIDITLTIILGLANLIGATLLFLLRKRAFDFFVIAFAANVSMTAGHIITKGFAAAMPAGGLTGILLGWGMLAAVCVYTKNLEKAEVLK